MRHYNGYTCICLSGYYGNRCYVDACKSSPCRNSGACIRNHNSYTCSCASGYTGTNCQLRTGQLRVHIRTGHNLPDADLFSPDYSDPYVKVVAYDSDGHSITRRTSYKQGNHNPTWNEWLYFGTDTWRKFTVEVYDADDLLTGSDDPMSGKNTYYLNSHTAGTTVTMNCNRGHIVFDYNFEA